MANEFQELKEQIKRLNSEKATRIQEENKKIREEKKRVREESEKRIREETEKRVHQEMNSIAEINLEFETRRTELQEKMEMLGNKEVNCVCGDSYLIKDHARHVRSLKHIRLSLINQTKMKKPLEAEETKNDV